MFITTGKDFGNEEIFILPREYLTTVSEYFENMFQGAFRETTDKKVALNDVEPVIFRLFIEWLNNRRLHNTKREIFDGSAQVQNYEGYKQLLDLYVFSDEYDVPQLRRDVLDALVLFSHLSPTLFDMELVAQAYDKLPSNSPLLRFLVDEYAANWAGPVEDVRDDTPTAFLWDLTKTFCDLRRIRRRTGKIEEARFPSKKLCDYHEHRTDDDVESSDGKKGTVAACLQQEAK